MLIRYILILLRRARSRRPARIVALASEVRRGERRGETRRTGQTYRVCRLPAGMKNPISFPSDWFFGSCQRRVKNFIEFHSIFQSYVFDFSGFAQKEVDISEGGRVSTADER